ncbi:MAG: hypothetical protein ACRDH7_07890 [Actinomycetota bacterium]
MRVAVTQEWSWPLLRSVGAGVVVLGVIGWAMCIFSGSTTSVPSTKDPFAVVAVVKWLVSTTVHALTRKPNAA